MHLSTSCIVLVSLCLFMKLACIALLLELQVPSSSRYCMTSILRSRSDHPLLTPEAVAYVGSDYPRVWDIGLLRPIRMNIEPTKHYQLSGPSADAEWAALAPNNGVFHLGPRRQPYSISLFHQLRCLDIIRRDLVESLALEDSKLSRHCINYMRQMVLCRADLAVDAVLGRELEPRVRADTNQCVDWRRVYEELEKNQREYARWAAEYQIQR